MLIRLGYDIRFDILAPVPMVALLNVHPSRLQDLREEDRLKIEPEVPLEEYRDVFGNIATRFMAPAGFDPPHELDADRGLGPARSDLPERPRGAGRRIAAGNAALSDEQPVLRGRPAVADCGRALRRRAARLGARAGHLHLGEHEGDVQLRRRRGPPARRSTSSPSASASAATSSTSPSPSAAP